MKELLKKTLAIGVVATAALWAGGCAKQQVVKPDQIAPNTAPQTAALPVTTKPAAVAKPEVKERGVAAPAIQESAVKKELQPAPEVALKDALEKIYFDFDSSTLSDQARQALTKNAQLLQKNRNARIKIEGHCDELGSDDYNLALGERRANAAVKYLQTLGVPSEMLSSISYGKERPADSGHDDAARAKNRRDEFVVTSK